MSKLTHLNENGEAHMVDVTAKPTTNRIATAVGSIRMSPQTLALIADGGLKKGDVLAVARIAGIQAAKRCAELIPLCHGLLISSAEVTFVLDNEISAVAISATCKVSGPTGVEMEALTAVSVAALTIYDMCKAVDRSMIIEGICLLEKTGGRSGHYRRLSGSGE